jgi:predicted nucleotidyltransferase
MTDRQTIIDEIEAIEADCGVRVLYACESGSRAYGFASPDSDYDVRFVYQRPVRDYLQLSRPKDTIGRPISDGLDIVGWDLSKFLTLMGKSNPSVFEWLGSPVVYRMDTAFRMTDSIAAMCFDPVRIAHHYLGMLASDSQTHLRGDYVDPKRYLHMVREVMSCRWVLETYEPVPVDFGMLLERSEGLAGADFRSISESLAHDRIDMPKGALMPRDHELESLIGHEITDLRAKLSLMEPHVMPQSEEIASVWAKMLGI